MCVSNFSNVLSGNNHTVVILKNLLDLECVSSFRIIWKEI